MNLLWKIIRTLLFLILVYYFMYSVFWAANWFWLKISNFLGYLESKVNPFVFWMLLFFALGSIIVYSWRGLKFCAVFIQSVIMKITPYRAFAYWSIIIIGTFQSIPFLYGYWFYGGSPNTVNTWIFGFIYSYILTSLLYFLVIGAYKSRLILDAKDYEVLVDELEEAKIELEKARLRLEIHELETKIQDLKDGFNASLKE